MPEYLNLSPGPTNYKHFLDIEEEGLIIPHGSRAFAELYSRTIGNLRILLNVPDQAEIVLITTSGTGGIEALLLNALEPGDRILVLSNGYFGERLARMAKTLGFDPYVIESEWDRPIEIEHILEVIHSEEFRGTKAVAIVHLETSTGLLNDIETLGRALKTSGVLYLVDAVSSVGPHLVEMDAWGIDGLATVTYKGLLSPPGLSILVLSEKYCREMRSRPTRSFYFDLKKIIEFSQHSTTAMTVPINSLLTLDRVLNHILSQDKAQYCGECSLIARSVRRELIQIGYCIYGREGHSSGITALKLDGIFGNLDARVELEKRYHVFVGSGLGKLQGKVIRIGHYGTLTHKEVHAVTALFCSILEQQGRKCVLD